jgi:hypothetical protein
VALPGVEKTVELRRRRRREICERQIPQLGGQPARHAGEDLATAKQILEEHQKWEEIGVVIVATFAVYCVGGKASAARRTAREAMAHESIGMGPDGAMRFWDEWTHKTRHHGLWNTGRFYI